MEADEISDGLFHRFGEAKRIHAEVTAATLPVFFGMLAYGHALDEAIAERNQAAVAARGLACRAPG